MQLKFGVFQFSDFMVSFQHWPILFSPRFDRGCDPISTGRDGTAGRIFQANKTDSSLLLKLVLELYGLNQKKAIPLPFT